MKTHKLRLVKKSKKVKFVDDFKEKWIEWAAEVEGVTVERAEDLYIPYEYYESFYKLEKRVSGNVGFVIQGGGSEWLEVEDYNWCIPERCFEFLD